MDSKNIVQQGEEVKYKITITRQGFNQQNDNFRVKLSWGMLRQNKIIPKNDMLTNENGDWFFVFDTTDMVGRIMAECSFDIPDDDYPDGLRTEINRQYLCLVLGHPLPARICVPATATTGTVKYERTEASDVEELYSYLTDRNSNRFTSSDSEYICVLKEF